MSVINKRRYLDNLTALSRSTMQMFKTEVPELFLVAHQIAL